MQVIVWFKNTSITVRDRFTQFDIEDFYASITVEFLIRALDFGSQICKSAELDREVILHARRTLLFSGEDMWIKGNSDKEGFGVSMGSYESAGICDLIALFLMDMLGRECPEVTFGIYKDDILALTHNTNGPALNRLAKDIIKVMNDFNMVLDTNLKVVNFFGCYLKSR